MLPFPVSGVSVVDKSNHYCHHHYYLRQSQTVKFAFLSYFGNLSDLLYLRVGIDILGGQGGVVPSATMPLRGTHSCRPLSRTTGFLLGGSASYWVCTSRAMSSGVAVIET